MEGQRQQSSEQRSARRRRRVGQEIAQEEESPPFIFYPALALLPSSLSLSQRAVRQGLANFRDRESPLKFRN